MTAPLVEVACTRRLRLREATLADAVFVRGLVSQDSWSRNIGPVQMASLNDAQAYVRTRLIERYAEQGFGLWLICHRPDDRPIGMAGLVSRPVLPGPDLGFALLDDQAGQGYAFEASQAVLEVARMRFGLDELYAVVKPDNAPSIRLLRRLGFAMQQSGTRIGDTDLAVYHRPLP